MGASAYPGAGKTKTGPSGRMAWGLGGLRAPGGVQRLVARLKSENIPVRIHAAEVLSTITGQALGQDCEAWRVWLLEAKAK